VGQVATFPVDHIIPQTSGGLTIPENLALACPHCNAHKWSHTDGIDPDGGGTSRLFNPRTDTWSGHFEWSRDGNLEIIGLTPIGRATVTRLQMNAPDVLIARRLLTQLGIM
jgi:hypothetical protein